MNVPAATVVEPTVMVTGIAAARPSAGVVNVRDVPFAATVATGAEAPNPTRAPWRFAPVIVTRDPPAIGPVAGDSPVTVGAM